jgi:hypothetical protein
MTRSNIALYGSLAIQMGVALAAAPKNIAPDAGAAPVTAQPVSAVAATAFIPSLSPMLSTVCLH